MKAGHVSLIKVSVILEVVLEMVVRCGQGSLWDCSCATVTSLSCLLIINLGPHWVAAAYRSPCSPITFQVSTTLYGGVSY